MEYHRQTMNSEVLSGVLDLPPSLQSIEVDVIILPAVNKISEVTKPKRKRKLDFVDVPPLPDSFFDPLPEEELQLWGL